MESCGRARVSYEDHCVGGSCDILSVKRDLGDGGHFGRPNISHRQSEVVHKGGGAGDSFKNRLQGGIGHDVQVIQVTVLVCEASSAAQHELSDEGHIVGQDEMINDRAALVEDA